MPRRRRLLITPASERIDEYKVGVESGVQKYEKKIDSMKRHATGGLSFTTALDDLISSVLDRYGIIGQRRIPYYVVGRKMAKMIVGYPNADVNKIRDLIAVMIRSYTIQEGVNDVIAAEIAETLIARRHELIKTYGLAS